MLFLSIEYTLLHPGFQYLYRVRGLNVAGEGIWSEPTLSINAFATNPDPPSQPRLLEASLRSLTFQWDPPHDDGGTAITGYRLHLKNLDKILDLPRSSITYTWEGLFPGKAYYLRVLAKNTVGFSEYSAYNEEKDAYTMIAPPERPMNPLAVAATWNSLTFEMSLPYHNGSMITQLEIERRFIRPFLIGEWESYESVMSNKLNAALYQAETKFLFSLKRLLHPSKDIEVMNTPISANHPNEVEVLEYVDLQEQQEQLEQKVRELELLKNAPGSIQQKGAKHSKINQQIEQLLLQQVDPIVYSFHSLVFATHLILDDRNLLARRFALL